MYRKRKKRKYCPFHKKQTNLLIDAEKEMDRINGKHGSGKELCLFCGSQEANSVVGIEHSEDCIIKKIRKEVE